MIPDLGKYAFTVLASYGATLSLLAAIIGLSWWRSSKVKAQLAEAEARRQAAVKG